MFVGRRDGVQWLRLGYAGCEPARVDQRGKLGQSRRVGVNPFVVDPDAAQRGRSRPGGDGHERPAITNSVKRPKPDRRSVQRTVHALGDHATHGGAEVVEAGDEIARTEPPDEPPGTIKLQFRKLNSILSEQVGRVARDGGEPQPREARFAMIQTEVLLSIRK